MHVAAQGKMVQSGGARLLLAGLGLMVVCHAAGAWELLSYRGRRTTVATAALAYPVQVYDARPWTTPAVGHVVIFPGFGASGHFYFPLAKSLLRAGYTVRLVEFSGTPKSPTRMAYDSHLTEAVGAAQEVAARAGDRPVFLLGHSEGTRWALRAAAQVPEVASVCVLSTISASAQPDAPPNLLALVAEHDLEICRRQTGVLLRIATGEDAPVFGTEYGRVEDHTRRLVREIAGANHGSIVWNADAHRALVQWFNRLSGSTRAFASAGIARTWLAVLGVLLGAGAALVGAALVFRAEGAPSPTVAVPGAAVVGLAILGWSAGVLTGDWLRLYRSIPLLVLGRVLVVFAVAGIPYWVVAVGWRRRTAGLPRGAWTVRGAALCITAGLLPFDWWFIGVVPSGARLGWFVLVALVVGLHLAGDELVRRAVQRQTDWRTGLALGLATALIAALALAGAGFFARPPVGEFLVGAGLTIFLLLAAGEVAGTVLFACTGDWLVSWWVRLVLFVGFLLPLVPLIAEREFIRILP